MWDNKSSMSKVVLLGLGDPLAAELMGALSRENQATYSFPSLPTAECLEVIERSGADLVFCNAEPQQYTALLESLRQKKTNLPVVVVSRYPEVPQWLDALEAGASDYCAPPFEATHVQWILQRAAQSRHLAA